MHTPKCIRKMHFHLVLLPNAKSEKRKAYAFWVKVLRSQANLDTLQSSCFWSVKGHSK